MNNTSPPLSQLVLANKPHAFAALRKRFRSHHPFEEALMVSLLADRTANAVCDMVLRSVDQLEWETLFDVVMHYS